MLFKDLISIDKEIERTENRKKAVLKERINNNQVRSSNILILLGVVVLFLLVWFPFIYEMYESAKLVELAGKYYWDYEKVNEIQNIYIRLTIIGCVTVPSVYMNILLFNKVCLKAVTENKWYKLSSDNYNNPFTAIYIIFFMLLCTLSVFIFKLAYFFALFSMFLLFILLILSCVKRGQIRKTEMFKNISIEQIDKKILDFKKKAEEIRSLILNDKNELMKIVKLQKEKEESDIEFEEAETIMEMLRKKTEKEELENQNKELIKKAFENKNLNTEIEND